MKKIISISVLTMMFACLFAQPGKKPAVTSPAKSNPHLKVFYQALNCNDLPTAVSALNYYISEIGTNTPYADTLAMIYMQQGGYVQSYYWADLRLRNNPEDNTLLELKGMALDKLNSPKEAITVYEKLFAKTQSPFHGYKLMELQYSIKRLAECVATANVTEKLKFEPAYIIPYAIGDQNGRTYLQAGVFNIHGIALYELDQKADAKAYFAKAVALDSNFVLAKQNLEAMNAQEKAPVKNPANPNTQGNPTNPANKQN
jgi:tetratricopeptide (TPR) repeat protein